MKYHLLKLHHLLPYFACASSKGPGGAERWVEHKIVNIFSFICLNICFGGLKELSHWDSSFEYPQHISDFPSPDLGLGSNMGPFPIKKWAKTSQNGVYHSQIINSTFWWKFHQNPYKNSSYSCMKICIKMWMKTCFHSHFYTNILKVLWRAIEAANFLYPCFILDCITFSQLWWSKYFFPN